MFPGLHIRNAKPDDSGAIAAIYGFYVLTTCSSFEETPPDSGEIRARMHKVVASGLPWLVAEDPEGNVVGYAYASPFHTRCAYRFTVENSVYVDSAHLRRGIATQLMRQLMADCEALGYRQMIAVIGDSANDASIWLHSGLGFERAGALTNVGFKFGRWVNTVMMQRLLGNGARTPPSDAGSNPFGA